MQNSIERMDTTYRPAIPITKRAAIATYALGSSAEPRTIAELFGVGTSTVNKIMYDFAQAVCNNLKDEMNAYPPTEHSLNEILDGFDRQGLPQCYGAIGITKRLHNSIYYKY